ncbi:MAG: hypothetical protein AAFN81_28670, partial [Bacteroidota bacterium]
MSVNNIGGGFYVPAPPNTDNQTLSIGANQLAISGGNSVDLTPYLDNTDAQVLAVTAVAGGTNLSISNGNTIFIPDNSGTDDQTLNLIGTSLAIEDGNSIDLSALLDNTDNQVLTLSGNSIQLTSDDGTDTIDLSPYLDNTDSQVLFGNLTGTDLILNVSGGNTITIPLASIDTDDQTLSLVGNALTIADGNTVDLSAFLDNTDNQVLSLAGNVLTLSSDDGNDTVNLAAYLDNTDAQTLSVASVAGGVNISVSNGNTIFVPIPPDTDDQTLSLIGDTLSIADGNSVDLSQYEETANVTTIPVRLEFASGSIAANGSTLFLSGATVTRAAAGQYNVVFASAHPD